MKRNIEPTKAKPIFQTFLLCQFATLELPSHVLKMHAPHINMVEGGWAKSRVLFRLFRLNEVLVKLILLEF
jgi:hypothetical protein